MTEPLDAGGRLRRLLAILAYLAGVGEATIAELSERFSMDERALVAELELAACCGLPPYTPDQLLELVLDDERVVAYGLEALRRPARLSPDEGFAVAAAARALMAVPGADPDGPLGSALAKLEAALGEDRLRVELDTAEQTEHLEVLRRAAADHELVEIDYLGGKRGDETTRVVEPHAVAAREGRFYLDAYCHLADGWRRFQVERVRAVRPLGTPFSPRTPPEELGGLRAFAGGPGTRLARVALPERLQALVERVAAGPAERLADGRAVVPVEVADEHWFGLLLLRLGPDVEVLSPPGLAKAGESAARRALVRYRTEVGASG
ncbi:MAG TPA: WYL domain-containing protein [Acidimicrobiales bacterium]|nr:WYL domain-containing protein [Acidimicrobiales bacterium]